MRKIMGMRTSGTLLLLIGGLLLVASDPALCNDPFGAAPKGTSPNCGPETRLSFPNTIRSPKDFAQFLRIHAAELVDENGNNWIQLDNYRYAKPGTRNAEREARVDWAKVIAATKTEKVGGQKIYSLDYRPANCYGGQFTVRMTTDGHVSVYGCCGK
jgi:hypothetical protein